MARFACGAPVLAALASLPATSLPLSARAATAAVTIQGPPGSVAFGTDVVVLPNGNVVVTDPSFRLPDGTPAVGAVHLFRPDGHLVSTLTGDVANSRIGTFVIVLANGNYVVASPLWSSTGAAFAGAVTFGNAKTGVSGIVGARNSLVGSSAYDSVGGVVPLVGGHYVVAVPNWDDGAIADAGAVVFCDGRTGTTGVVERTRPLVGSHAHDRVGESVTPLPGGGYVVASPHWSNGSATNAGAVTRGDGFAGTAGAVGPANSLVGARQDDQVGERITINPNGAYAIASPHWDADSAADAGVASFCAGQGACRGIVGPANSLIGSHAGDLIGSAGITVLANGHYVVRSPSWGDGVRTRLGAATWVDGTVGAAGTVGVGNSLIGATQGDQVSSNGVLALANGNYAVSSQFWHNGAVESAGAVSFGNGAAGTSGVVGADNSLVGAARNDSVSFDVALANGNYVVFCSLCDVGGAADAGAVVLGDGEKGTFGPIDAVNALVGSRAGDRVGASVQPLPNGHYVVHSPDWSNGVAVRVGAVTFVDGRAGVVGAVDATNSLVGSNALDSVGASGTRVLATGNYVVLAPSWRSGENAFAGAITLGDGRVGIHGEITPENSLVGEHAGDSIGSGQFVALANGDFIAGSPHWHRNGAADTGAATHVSGATRPIGTIAAGNSLLGATAGDLVGAKIRALPGNRYLVFAPSTDVPGPAGPIVDAGAVVPDAANGDIIAATGAVFGKRPQSGASTTLDANADLVAIGHPLENEVILVRFVSPAADRIFCSGFDDAEDPLPCASSSPSARQAGYAARPRAPA